MGTQRRDFAEFYRKFKDERLVTVLVNSGDQDTAQELVAEAFADLAGAKPVEAEVPNLGRCKAVNRFHR